MQDKRKMFLYNGLLVIMVCHPSPIKHAPRNIVCASSTIDAKVEIFSVCVTLVCIVFSRSLNHTRIIVFHFNRDRNPSPLARGSIALEPHQGATILCDLRRRITPAAKKRTGDLQLSQIGYDMARCGWSAWLKPRPPHGEKQGNQKQTFFNLTLVGRRGLRSQEGIRRQWSDREEERA